MNAYLKLDHIDKYFDKGGSRAEVLKGINLTIEKGEFVSVIGHSGCGKSTMLNRMTRSDVDAEDKLFATLDPTSRRLRFPEEREVILTDTVGFIRHLPKDLVHAFRSTLEEVQEADLLVHVIDSASPQIKTHVDEVEKTIAELGADSTPTIRVLNKIDAVDRDNWAALKHSFDGMLVSAHTGDGLGALMIQIERHLFREQVQGRLKT